jgi:hypothetical protein
MSLPAAGGATGQIRTSVDDELRARVLGVLMHTRVSVAFDGTPARAAFASLSAALGTPIVGRYSDDRFGHGILGETPVFFDIEDVPALFVLEMILDQCAFYEPCTWQLRNGYIEVGTKDRLSFPAATETRVYNVGDLLLEAPYFATRPDVGSVEADFEDHPYKTAALTRPVDIVGSGRPMGVGGIAIDSHTARKGPELLLQEIVEGIVETVEPGNWDWGQDSESRRDGRIARSARTNKIARLRVWQDSVVIAAPDYIHRQVGGYPAAIPPKPLTEDERRERSARASSEGGRVTVIGVRGRGGE